jgi:predicted transcriptional regulator
MNDSRRSKLEIYADILRVLAHHGPLKQTHIMYKAKVNCSVLKQFLDSLVQQKLIEEQILRKKGQRIIYSITERGKAALVNFEEITMALQSKKDMLRKYVFI